MQTTNRPSHTGTTGKGSGHFFFMLVCAVLVSVSIHTKVSAQDNTLLLPEAVDQGVQSYQSIQAKRNYVNASEALAKNARNQYLPNVIAAAQHNYGTINGQLGPLAPAGVLGVSSSGPTVANQSWNAAFGSIYIVSTNWEFFTFGRVRASIQAADAQMRRDSADLMQEKFVHSIKISSAYLNLLISQRLIQNAESNLDRALYVQRNVRARTLTGLNPGVDSSLANAELSRARLVLIDARNNEQQVRNQLAQFLNVAPDPFVLDTTLLSKIPAELNTSVTVDKNPQVRYYQARIDQANSVTKALRRTVMPSFTLFGIYQGRGSGFDYNYTPDFSDRYSKSYSDGINPSRYNYVAGVSLVWNVMSLVKVRQQTHSQSFLAAAYKNEYDQITTQLNDQLILADQRLQNTLQSIREVPLQYQAASDAFIQKSVLYKNGLTTIVDLQQAMYALNRAETDLGVAYVNIWQALLLKAAASGDFSLFINQTR